MDCNDANTCNNTDHVTIANHENIQSDIPSDVPYADHPWPIDLNLAHFDITHIFPVSFVCELENGKYYVGFSRNFQEFISRMIYGHGPKWTRLHRFKRIIETEALGNRDNHLAMTIRLINAKGSSNVRSSISGHSDLVLKQDPPQFWVDFVTDFQQPNCLVDRGQARDITSDNHDDDESCPDVGYRMARLSAATCTAAVSTSKRRREREWEDHALPRGEC